MLVLSRKAKQTILIGEEVVVTVLSVKGNRVRIGIEAPQDVDVVREELLPREPAAWSKSASADGRLGEDSPLDFASALPAR